MPGVTPMLALAGVLIVVAATAWGLPGRPPRAGPGSARTPARGRWRSVLRRWAPRRGARQVDLGSVLVEVAARLRAGADAETAWSAALAAAERPGAADGVDLPARSPLAAGRRRRARPGRDPARAAPGSGGARRRAQPRCDRARAAPGSGGERQVRRPHGPRSATTVPAWATGSGVPRALQELARRAAPGPARRRGAGPDVGQVAAAAATCRVAARLGAPLADVLERCADGLVEAAEAAAARRVALAGPRATARLLGWLPVAGVALGTLVGADPVGVLLGGGAGGWCLLLGTALMVGGNRWVRVLVRRAEAAAGSA